MRVSEQEKEVLIDVSRSISRPFNLIALGILLPILFVTEDWKGLIVLAAIESIWYVVPRSALFLYPPSLAGEHRGGELDHRTAALLFVTSAGVAIMTLFGFGKHVFVRVVPE